jgi:hypothetical protein
MHDADYDTDGADGEAYVPHDEEGNGEGGDSEDDERRTSSTHRTTKERVLSNRLAASRSYQRRKEEMLRLESNHARLQVWLEGVALYQRMFSAPSGDSRSSAASRQVIRN